MRKQGICIICQYSLYDDILQGFYFFSFVFVFVFVCLFCLPLESAIWECSILICVQPYQHALNIFKSSAYIIMKHGTSKSIWELISTIYYTVLQPWIGLNLHFLTHRAQWPTCQACKPQVLKDIHTKFNEYLKNQQVHPVPGLLNAKLAGPPWNSLVGTGGPAVKLIPVITFVFYAKIFLFCHLFQCHQSISSTSETNLTHTNPSIVPCSNIIPPSYFA